MPLGSIPKKLNIYLACTAWNDSECQHLAKVSFPWDRSYTEEGALCLRSQLTVSGVLSWHLTPTLPLLKLYNDNNNNLYRVYAQDTYSSISGKNSALQFMSPPLFTEVNGQDYLQD